MTRAWLTRTLLAVPLVASASLAQAQTPAAPATMAPKAAPAHTTAAPAHGTTAPAAPAHTMAAPEHTTANPEHTTAKPEHATAKSSGGTAAATAAPAMPVMKPAPELEQLKFLMGRWRCEGKQLASPTFGPEHTFKATAENKPAVDGFWDQYTYEEKKSKEHHPVKVQGFWGWDQGSKKLVRVGASNAGDWDEGSAPGLEGDKIVWTGEFSGPAGRMAYRHTFTKKTDREWMHTLEIKDPTGKFETVTEVDCKK